MGEARWAIMQLLNPDSMSSQVTKLKLRFKPALHDNTYPSVAVFRIAFILMYHSPPTPFWNTLRGSELVIHVRRVLAMSLVTSTLLSRWVYAMYSTDSWRITKQDPSHFTRDD